MGLNLDELRMELKRTDSPGGSGFLDNFVKMPDGEGSVTVRLLPPKKGNKLYCVTRTHRLQQKNFHCLQTLVGDKWQGMCPICNYYKKLWRDSDQVGGEQATALQTEARSIKPIERYYYNCLVREVIGLNGDKQRNVGPKILSIGKQLHARILRAILGDPAVDEPELGDVTDSQNGRDFKIIKKLVKGGADSFPNYDQSKFMSESILGTADEAAKWMENLHELQALRQIKTYDELMHELNIFRGLETDPELSSDAPSKPVTPVAKAAVVKVEAEDEALADDDFIKELRGM